MAGRSAANEVLPPALAAELLERALAYTRGALAGTREDELGLPTPCAAWTLGDLLAHMSDSLAALTEAAEAGVVRPPPPVDSPRVALVADVRARACRLLSAWDPWTGDGPVVLGDRATPRARVALVGALEIAIHGWDVVRSRGLTHPLPEHLARDLLPVAHDVISASDRAGRFAAPVAVSPWSSPDVRLLAFVGRTPG